ncbi:hypothetical protein [Daejeonella sp.]|jgi:hypothetical protein|uniref:hypothetical protein n=1 Tax=Daejeonella sp. TaxID=2805397 RepID=UPI0037C19B5A
MKKILFLIAPLALFSYACNNTDQQTIDKQDSLQEAAAADSMLNSAIMADSLMQDSLKKDSIK